MAWFKQFFLTRYVGSDFKVPSKKKTGGKTLFLLTFMPIFANKLSGNFLDIDFQTVYESNKRVTMENANLFGLSWIGDGATNKRMSLMNMLAMFRRKPQQSWQSLIMKVTW